MRGARKHTDPQAIQDEAGHTGGGKPGSGSGDRLWSAYNGNVRVQAASDILRQRERQLRANYWLFQLPQHTRHCEQLEDSRYGTAALSNQQRTAAQRVQRSMDRRVDKHQALLQPKGTNNQRHVCIHRERNPLTCAADCRFWFATAAPSLVSFCKENTQQAHFQQDLRINELSDVAPDSWRSWKTIRNMPLGIEMQHLHSLLAKHAASGRVQQAEMHNRHQHLWIHARRRTASRIPITRSFHAR